MDPARTRNAGAGKGGSLSELVVCIGSGVRDDVISGPQHVKKKKEKRIAGVSGLGGQRELSENDNKVDLSMERNM